MMKYVIYSQTLQLKVALILTLPILRKKYIDLKHVLASLYNSS